MPQNPVYFITGDPSFADNSVSFQIAFRMQVINHWLKFMNGTLMVFWRLNEDDLTLIIQFIYTVSDNTVTYNTEIN